MALPVRSFEGPQRETSPSSERRSWLPLSPAETPPAEPREDGTDGGARRLLSGELLRGGVVELCVAGPGAWGTSVALAACRRAQEEQARVTTPCAFLDPSASLYAPGVARAGVDLGRLLVLRPSSEELARVAVRLAESRLFSVLVIDLLEAPHRVSEISLGSWVRVVRKLTAAVSGTRNTVLLLTDQRAVRPLPLPVAQRIDWIRSGDHELLVQISKDPWGRALGPERLSWTRPALNGGKQVEHAR